MPSRDFEVCLQDAVKRYGRFSHAAHLHVAWNLLRDQSALDALAQFCTGLRALAQASGVADKYHETLTVAWFFVVLERLNREESWDLFEARNPDLFHADALDKYYPQATLNSAEARQGFLVPALVDVVRA